MAASRCRRAAGVRHPRRVTVDRGTRRRGALLTEPAGRIEFDDVHFSYPTGDGEEVLKGSRRRSNPASRSPSSARPGAASRPSPGSSLGSTTSPPGRCGSTVTTCAPSPSATFGRRPRRSPTIRSSSPRRSVTTSPSPDRAHPTTRSKRQSPTAAADFVADLPTARHRGRRARLDPLGRAASAHRHRSHAPRRPGRPDSRRRHQRHRCRGRGAHPCGARGPQRRPHHDPDRPPPLDDRPRRPGDPPRRRCRGRHWHARDLLATNPRYAAILADGRPARWRRRRHRREDR